MKEKILFVCLGNICRSPAAESIARKLASGDDNLDFDSAGTYGGHAGDLPDARMREAAERRGYQLTDRSRQVKAADFEEFDMLVAMDDSNYEALFRLAPTLEDRDKIFRMVDFSSRTDYSHIPDPYYEGREGFEIVLDLLEDACSGLIKQASEARMY